MKRLTDRVAIVTGAASGIGRATAVRLADEGAHVFCLDVQEAALAEVVAQVKQQGGDATVVRCDVSSEKDVDAAVGSCVQKHGRLDVACNAAGVLHTGWLHEIATADWTRLLGINLTGTLLVCRAALPHLIKTRGAIVNVASTAALAGQPYGAAYAATKGGVLALTRSLAIDYVGQVRVNAVCPGDIDTAMIKAFRLPVGANVKLLDRVRSPSGRGRPEDVAAVIAMLASDDGAFVTGESIRVDGGMLA